MNEHHQNIMETGKVEYAPDYKSKSQVKRIAAQRAEPYLDTVEGTKLQTGDDDWSVQLQPGPLLPDHMTDHQRLQSAVVEKARIMLELHESVGHVCLDVEDTLEATRALIAFEAQHGMGEK